MQAFQQLSGVVALLDRNNVDTDAIIPKQFMKTIGRTGLGPFAFDAWRYLDEGYWGQDCSTRKLNMEFELNQPRYAGASILLTRENFGCGSSREHAPWALMDMGIRAIIGVSFGDIFKANALKNGMLVVELPPELIAQLADGVRSTPGYRLDMDLVNRTIASPQLGILRFEFDDNWRDRLLRGLDDISLTLEDSAAISAFEQAHRQAQPWLFDEDAEPIAS